MEKTYLIPEIALDLLQRAATAPGHLVPGLIQAALSMVRANEASQANSDTDSKSE